VLDFHHIDKETKEFTIGAIKKGSKEKILKEIDKCVCLCANCHREFHHLEREQQITLQEYLDKD
jgi:predicted HNH restriction endonuclease